MTKYINKSQCVYLIGDGIIPISVEPNEVVDSAMLSFIPDHFIPFDVNRIYTYRKVNIDRQYALGDLIQLIPVVRHLKARGIDILISTSNRFVPYLKWLFQDIAFSISKTQDKTALKISLNGILERDHSLENKERAKHRVDIYSEFMGIAHKSKLDWGYFMKKDAGECFIKEGDNVIAIQLRGSGPIKTLPEDFVKKMAHNIAKTHKVLLIDQDPNKGFEGHNILNLCGKMNILDIVKTLEKCKCVLTMDSGVLWLAHVANCPTLTFLGSTREQERLSLHPQYPHGAKAINMAEAVGCTPCFETKANCKGSIRCMNAFDHDTIMKKVFTNLNSILSEVKNVEKKEKSNSA